MSGLVSSCVYTPVLSVPELLGSGASFVRPIGCLGCLEGMLWLPSPMRLPRMWRGGGLLQVQETGFGFDSCTSSIGR